eukprot:GSChrysophyteH1.ASY1.ANO1.2256.1 assembled CDS
MSALSLTSRRFLSKGCLLVASKLDVASMNLVNALTSRQENWAQLSESSTSSVWRGSHNSDVVLWLQNESLLSLDEAHDLVLSREDSVRALGVQFSEVIFLSRHSATSGIAALTVHPIGIPWLSETEKGRYGGQAGKCSPPSPRLACLYRGILSEASASGAVEKYQITMEATHHGPYSSVPACFVEIGSSAETWSDPQAGELWANVLEKELQLLQGNCTAPGVETKVGDDDDDDDDDDDEHPSRALVVIGGGHYVPKANDAAKHNPHLLIGHMLASYALQPILKPAETQEETEVSTPTWRSAILEAVTSTRTAHPTSEIVVWLNKTICKGTKLKEITDFLDEHCIRWTHQINDIASFAD